MAPAMSTSCHLLRPRQTAYYPSLPTALLGLGACPACISTTLAWVVRQADTQRSHLTHLSKSSRMEAFCRTSPCGSYASAPNCNTQADSNNQRR